MLTAQPDFLASEAQETKVSVCIKLLIEYYHWCEMEIYLIYAFPLAGPHLCRSFWDVHSYQTNVTNSNIDPTSTTSIFTSRPFLKTAGGIVLGSVAVSAVSAVSADVLPYISVAIKASFLKLGMCNICKNNIAKMFLDFWKILNCSFDRRF